MDPFRLPESIGRYKVLARLGRGAMGVVFSARDERLGRDVAIKIMNAGLDDEPDTRARFFREAQVTSKLLHRNIVTVFDLGEDGSRPFIVMELLKGKTLNHALKDSNLEALESKLDLMIQLCEGLSKAHAAGVVHRDVKPSNLYILPDGTLKILDFGVARLISSNMTRTGLIVGTPDYMSPEQARGGEVDERSDVFSAAAVFYLMLTGRKPFAGTEVATLRRVIKDDPDPLAETEAPAPLARIVMRALSKDPAARYQRCVEMAADLIRFKKNFDTETRQVGSSAKAQFDEVLRLAAAIRELLAREGLPPAEWVEQECRLLQERHPYFVTLPDGATPVAIPFRRNHLARIAAELSSLIERLSTEHGTIEADSARRKQQIEQTAGRIAAALQEANFERAETLIEEGVLAGLDRDRLDSFRTALADGRFVTGAIAAARSARTSGAWDEAVAGLQTAAQSRPDLPALQAELARLTADRARFEAAAAREREIAATLEDASDRLGLGDYAGAVRAAEAVLALEPGKTEALRIREEANAGLERQAQFAILAARSRSHISQALRHLAASRFAEAGTEAAAAAGLTPDEPKVQAVMAEASRLQQLDEAVRQRFLERQERERDVTRLIASARAKLAAGERTEALREAEKAVALDSAHEGAQLILDHIRSFLSLLSNEDDDTQTIAPEPAETSSTLEPRTRGAFETAWRWISDKLKARQS